MILYGIEEGVPQGVGAQEGEIESPFKDLPEGTDPFMVLGNLPKEQFDAMKEKMNKQFENIPDSMIIQSAIKFIKSEYEEIE